jgi:hypothetical protein
MSEFTKQLRFGITRKPPVDGEVFGEYDIAALERLAEAAADILDKLERWQPAELDGKQVVCIPLEATPGLLMSMAIRDDHALGMPGYYDQPFVATEGVTHAKRVESALRKMSQLHEEVVGKGFYKPHLEDQYTARAEATTKGTS